MIEFLEKDLEDLIFHSERSELEDRGLEIYGKLKRQLRIGNYGVCDLMSITRPSYCKGAYTYYKGTITIYELKKGSVGVSALMQCVRYAAGVKKYLIERNAYHLFNIEICLIGTRIDKESSMYFLPFLSECTDTTIDEPSIVSFKFYTTNFSLEGVSFNEFQYNGLINNGF